MRYHRPTRIVCTTQCIFPRSQLSCLHVYILVHGIGTEVLHPPTTLQEWYHFVQGNDTNQNRGVPNDLIGMHYTIWAIFKMAAFENDENNKATRSPEISREQVQKLTPQFLKMAQMA